MQKKKRMYLIDRQLLYFFQWLKDIKVILVAFLSWLQYAVVAATISYYIRDAHMQWNRNVGCPGST